MRDALRMVFVSVALTKFYGCELLCEGSVVSGEVVDIFMFVHLSQDSDHVSLIDAKLTEVLVQAVVLIQQMCLIMVAVLLLSSAIHFCLCM